MSEQDQFTETPISRGFHVGKITVIVGIIVIVGIALVVIAIFQKPGGDVQQHHNATSSIRTAKPASVKNSDDEIEKIISNSQTPIVNTNQNGDKTINVESVPPILTTGAQTHGVQTVQPGTNVDDIQHQIIQARNQAKLKRIQAEYAAYSSKTKISLGDKDNASGIVNSNVSTSRINSDDSKQLASAAKKTDTTYTSAKLTSPKSPFELKAGALIPCVMISGLNSEISGTVKGQVTENVYDSVNGRYLLIPQGSVLIGTYSNTILYGNNRIGVGWNTLTFPNGDSIDLQGLPGSDLEGFNGLSDIVDNHYWSLFGTSFIMGVITAGMQYSQNNTNSNVQSGGIGYTNPNPSAGQTLSGSLGQQLGQTGLAVTNKGLNVAPTIIIRQGMQFNIMLTATMVLQPYLE